MFTYLFTYLHVYFKNDLLSKNCKRMESSNSHFAQLFLQMDQGMGFWVTAGLVNVGLGSGPG